MKCNHARQLLPTYLDSELEPTPSLEIAKHLEACSACQEHFASELKWNRVLASALLEEGDDPQALSRLSEFMFALRAHPAGSSKGKRRVLIAAILVAVLLPLVVTIHLASNWSAPAPDSESHDLAEEVLLHHKKFLNGTLKPVPDSDSVAAANHVFRTGLPFPMDVAADLPTTWRVTGALCCTFRQAKTGCLKFQIDHEPVSIFAFSDQDLASFPDAAKQLHSVGSSITLQYKGSNLAILRTGTGILSAMGSQTPEALLEMLRTILGSP